MVRCTKNADVLFMVSSKNTQRLIIAIKEVLCWLDADISTSQHPHPLFIHKYLLCGSQPCFYCYRCVYISWFQGQKLFVQPSNVFSTFLTVSDYNDGVYQFEIPPEQQDVTISIPITDDTTVEPLREQFSISISLQPQSGLSLGDSQGSVTIVDNDGVTFIHLINHLHLKSL